MSSNLSQICHNEETLRQLPMPYRSIVLEIAKELPLVGTLSPLLARDIVRRVMRRNEIAVPDDLYENVDADDSMEVWATGQANADLQFLFATGPILTMTSYSIEDLVLNPWPELFGREEFFSRQIIKKLQQAILNNQSQKPVTSWHEVRELKSPRMRRLQVMVKQITPFRSASGLAGAFALVKARPLVLPTHQTLDL